jgi:hypothetical protein
MRGMVFVEGGSNPGRADVIEYIPISRANQTVDHYGLRVALVATEGRPHSPTDCDLQISDGRDQRFKLVDSFGSRSFYNLNIHRYVLPEMQ